MMTWEQFKTWVEKQGIRDEDEIDYFDFSDPVDGSDLDLDIEQSQDDPDNNRRTFHIW